MAAGMSKIQFELLIDSATRIFNDLSAPYTQDNRINTVTTEFKEVLRIFESDLKKIDDNGVPITQENPNEEFNKDKLLRNLSDVLTKLRTVLDNIKLENTASQSQQEKANIKKTVRFAQGTKGEGEEEPAPQNNAQITEEVVEEAPLITLTLPVNQKKKALEKKKEYVNPVNEELENLKNQHLVSGNNRNEIKNKLETLFSKPADKASPARAVQARKDASNYGALPIAPAVKASEDASSKNIQYSSMPDSLAKSSNKTQNNLSYKKSQKTLRIFKIKLDHLARKYNENNSPEARADFIKDAKKYHKAVSDIKAYLEWYQRNSTKKNGENKRIETLMTQCDNVLNLIEPSQALTQQTQITLHADRGKYCDDLEKAKAYLDQATNQMPIASLAGSKKQTIAIEDNKPLARQFDFDIKGKIHRGGTIAHTENGVFRNDIYANRDVLASLPKDDLRNWARDVINGYYADKRCDGPKAPVVINGIGLPKQAQEALVLAAIYKLAQHHPSARDVASNIVLKNCGDLNVKSLIKTNIFGKNKLGQHDQAEKKANQHEHQLFKHQENRVDNQIKPVTEPRPSKLK